MKSNSESAAENQFLIKKKQSVGNRDVQFTGEIPAANRACIATQAGPPDTTRQHIVGWGAYSESILFPGAGTGVL